MNFKKVTCALILSLMVGCNSASIMGQPPEEIEIVSHEVKVVDGLIDGEPEFHHSVRFRSNVEEIRVSYCLVYNSTFFIHNAEDHHESIESEKVYLRPSISGLYEFEAIVFYRGYQAHLWDTEIIIEVETDSDTYTHQIIEYGSSSFQ